MQLDTPRRKGAARRADVSPALKKQLNSGAIEALTLSEMLVIDFALLMKNVCPKVHPKTLAAMHGAREEGWVGRTRLAGQLLLDDLGHDIFPHLISHSSDQARGWAASLVAADKRMNLKKRLSIIRPLADDPNPGVRETAWIMLRPHVAGDLDTALEILQPWTEDKSANIRRFASEITRPRGVWCAYLPTLQKNPEMALDILEPLRSDPSRYVQNSIANWLNDSSKDRADFVMQLTKRWEKESKTKETAYIVKRARRTMNKSKA